MTISADLPKWADHPGHDKIDCLTEPGPPPEPIVVNWLANLKVSDRPLRILDVGAGRGGLVAWLCKNGYDAYGVEPNPRYVENSRAYFTNTRLGKNRVQSFQSDGSYPFEDGWFDIVHSNQVIEHVENIETFASEVSRVTRAGGRGVHIFPAKWEPIEGHMHMPLVHWLPKGSVRRQWIKFALWSGQAAPYFTELSLDDRTEVFQRFSEDETFYRTGRKVSQIFLRHNLDSNRRELAAEKLRSLNFPEVASPVFAALREAYITTSKR